MHGYARACHAKFLMPQAARACSPFLVVLVDDIDHNGCIFTPLASDTVATEGSPPNPLVKFINFPRRCSRPQCRIDLKTAYARQHRDLQVPNLPTAFSRSSFILLTATIVRGDRSLRKFWDSSVIVLPQHPLERASCRSNDSSWEGRRPSFR
ncbi:hypothetical protein CPB83DRAFT_862407 [Crepidotus variabilis]|uniref:Uncharacterized protein n=1 Tax=Crepidotus variabilis TaxID=179855 RepID=A0A9P6E744_9AGAR|nr:hypothetical protein CPB83DRAFT_862407 [Crepidotus variabilis]